MEGINIIDEFLERYGEVVVTFVYYYKYSFFFVGEFEGKIINISIGGSADDIYKLEIESKKKYKVRELSINYASIKKVIQLLLNFTGVNTYY